LGGEVNNIVADLHMHSTFSDGKFSPEQIDALFSDLNFQAISITDHDTLDHVAYISKNIDKFTLDIIPGVEVSCKFEGIDMHLLVYYVDKSINFLTDYFESYRLLRINRVEEIISKLKKNGIALNPKNIIDKFNNPSRLHIAQQLVLNGYAKSIKLAFKKFLIKSSKYYVPINKISLIDLVDCLTPFNCITSIAHPIISLGKKNLGKILNMNIDGVEAFHPTHSLQDESILLSICNENSLLVTGGSDFHGWNKNDFRIGRYGLNNKKFNFFQLN
jgi:hypothetical protein